ncbi:MAG: RNase P subunit p30-domain-containing protein [Piptocephalis tieghemiana]|nr:MAG: RNase P subunit p30-domain-containing protein [Piptocephalis tieghemiana]
MYCDLSLDAGKGKSALLDKTVSRAFQLGYTTIAIDWVVEPTTKQFKGIDKGSYEVPKGKRLLHRCTIPLGQGNTGNRIAALAAVEGHFDVVAVQPTDEASFGAACNMDQQAVDMISMDLSRRQSFHFRYSQVGVAIQRGFYFEICYGAAIHDVASRRHLIANAQGLVRASRGRNLILSSRASRALSLRGPADVMNLASLFNLSGNEAKDALVTAPRRVIMHAAYRKDAVKSAIVILPSGEKEEGKRESSSQTKGENEKRRLSKAKDEDKVIKKSRSVQEQGK